MALIAYDGFDHYNTNADMEQRFGALQYSQLAALTQPTAYGAGRGGFGKALYIQTNYGNQASVTFAATLSAAVNKLTWGMAYNFQGLSVIAIIEVWDAIAATKQCQWVINSGSGLIQFYDATGTIRETALNAVGVNGWYFIEMQNTISTSVGTAALRVNGQALASFPDATGLNTQASANASCSAIYVTTGGHTIDDLYFCDGTTGPGSYPCNSFLGDTRCDTLFPISNSSVAWVPLTGTNWSEVSETAADGDGSYNRTATAGAQDSFNFATLGVEINQVIGLQMTIFLRKEDAGARTVAPVVVISGSTYVGTAVSVDVSYLYITSIWATNPHTGASWTASDVNGMQAGYVVVT